MNEIPHNNEDIIDDSDFSYDGFQVVRGEFFAHIFEPSFTLNNYKCGVNTACIKRLPDYDYVQILVNPTTKKVAVRPCSEEEKDSLRWCSASGKRTPKQITCRIFYAKIMSLMNWDTNYRYKLLGKLIRSNGELLYVFDLNSAETFKRSVTEDGKVKTQKTPTYPDDWKNQFGLPVVEHKKSMQVNTFDNYAVFSLNLEQEKVGNFTENREEHYEQITFTQEPKEPSFSY